MYSSNINEKKKNGMLARSRVCAPYKEGGLGVRSIIAANEGCLFKLTWEILSGKDMGLTFILNRHTTSSGADVKYHISSSIWSGIGRIREVIRQNIRWIPGAQSNVRFWMED